MKGLLLAGGTGTRLRPLTFTGNKHMLPIANKPMLLYGLEHLRNAGINEIGIILGPIKEGIREVIGDGSAFNVNVTYIDQDEPKGIAHAVLTAEEFLRDEEFVVYLGDNLLKQGVKPFVDEFDKNGSDCLVGVTKVKDPSSYGIVEMDNGKIVRLVEKPKKTSSNLALIGIYVFNQEVFCAIKQLKPSWRNEFEITEAIQTLHEWNKKVHVKFVEGWWKDTGKPEDLLEANQLILQDLESFNKGTVEDGLKITGHVGIGEGTIIHKDCIIRGPVIIGKNCRMGPNTYLGPHTSIGDNTVIKGGEVENCIIMNNVHIDCGKRIVDSVIGSNTSIVNSEQALPRGYKFILGERTFASI